MSSLVPGFPEIVAPTEAEVRMAERATHRLPRLLRTRRRSLRVIVQAGDQAKESIEIPTSAFRLLADILAQMAEGHAITVVPIPGELTTQQAAELLNVSRPFLIRLIEERRIPHRKVGTHRRIRVDDLVEYQRRIDSDRLKVLEELTAEAQRLRMGYEG
jgi:excisionase family DNA binding protein